jgi:hypothetical protein
MENSSLVYDGLTDKPEVRSVVSSAEIFKGVATVYRSYSSQRTD